MCPMEHQCKIIFEIQLDSNVFINNLNTNQLLVSLKNSIFEWFLDWKDKKHAETSSSSIIEFEIVDDFPEDLKSKIKKINICFLFCYNFVLNELPLKKWFSNESHQLVFNFYQLHNDHTENFLEEDLPCALHTYLPSEEFDGLWNSLIFDSDLKYELLNYCRTSIMFGKRKINPILINCNKVLLLHGPPGTGKTSLCKALCQKLSIIFNNFYENFQLIEINAHSLFSKWFSESGKLVLKLFDNIREYAKDDSNMIFVLIDEVESLVYDRQRANGSDPSDAVRVVNALLTQIDSIKQFPNIMILSNSNVTNAMDNAFIDRADIKQYIGYPSNNAIFQIYLSCFKEFIRSKMITVNKINNHNDNNQHQNGNKVSPLNEISESNCLTKENNEKLLKICSMSQNFSGRTLRKLPFVAFALYCNYDMDTITIDEYLNALMKTIEKHLEDNKHFNNYNNID